MFHDWNSSSLKYRVYCRKGVDNMKLTNLVSRLAYASMRIGPVSSCLDIRYWIFAIDSF